MDDHKLRSWIIGAGLLFTFFGSAWPAFANSDKNCGLKSGATIEDETSASHFGWPTYCLRDIGTLLSLTYSYAASINNRGQVVVDSGEVKLYPGGGTSIINRKALIYKDGRANNIADLPGGFGIAINGINDSGKAVGYSLTDYYPVNPVIYNGGKTVRIAGLGTLAIPEAINNSGHIAGFYMGRYGPEFPFLYIDGKVTAPVEAGEAYGINNSDVVVGERIDYGGLNPNRAFMYKDGKATDLGTLPGHVYSAAYAINDRGQIVGVSAPTPDPEINGARAFLYDPQRGMVSLGTLRTTDAYSRAVAINKCGHVVGFSGSKDTYSTSDLSAFLYAKGKMVDLNSRILNRSAFRLTAASAINDHGQIVGRGWINGQLHAFLLTSRYGNAGCARAGGRSQSDEPQ